MQPSVATGVYRLVHLGDTLVRFDNIRGTSFTRVDSAQWRHLTNIDKTSLELT